VQNGPAAHVRTLHITQGWGGHQGEDFVGLLAKRENLVFPLLANSRKMTKTGPNGGLPLLVSKTAPSLAQPIKNILVGPDGSGGPPEPSGPTRMFFMGRAHEGAGCAVPRRTRGGGEVCADFPKKWVSQNRKSQNSQGMDPGGARFRAWRTSCRAFRWVKRGPDAQNLLRRVCFSPEKTKRGR